MVTAKVIHCGAGSFFVEKSELGVIVTAVDSAVMRPANAVRIELLSQDVVDLVDALMEKNTQDERL